MSAGRIVALTSLGSERVIRLCRRGLKAAQGAHALPGRGLARVDHGQRDHAGRHATECGAPRARRCNEPRAPPPDVTSAEEVAEVVFFWRPRGPGHRGQVLVVDGGYSLLA
jgi:DNA segregation ATPase FtsK/SpoIIIE-like protein